VAEIGDVRRFATPWQLMAYLGLVPSERSTGEQVRRGSITKATQEPAVCSSRAPGLIAIQLT
jgi:transposase